MTATVAPIATRSVDVRRRRGAAQDAGGVERGGDRGNPTRRAPGSRRSAPRCRARCRAAARRPRGAPTTTLPRWSAPRSPRLRARSPARRWRPPPRETRPRQHPVRRRPPCRAGTARASRPVDRTSPRSTRPRPSARRWSIPVRGCTAPSAIPWVGPASRRAQRRATPRARPRPHGRSQVRLRSDPRASHHRLSFPAASPNSALRSITGASIAASAAAGSSIMTRAPKPATPSIAAVVLELRVGQPGGEVEVGLHVGVG